MQPVPTAVMVALAVVLTAVAYARGGGLHLQGLREGGQTLLVTLPILVASFVVAGLVQVLIPREFVARWLGDQAGIRLILVGCLAGGPHSRQPVRQLPHRRRVPARWGRHGSDGGLH